MRTEESDGSWLVERKATSVRVVVLHQSDSLLADLAHKSAMIAAEITVYIVVGDFRKVGRVRTHEVVRKDGADGHIGETGIRQAAIGKAS
jgi:hypothetical protein